MLHSNWAGNFSNLCINSAALVLSQPGKTAQSHDIKTAWFWVCTSVKNSLNIPCHDRTLTRRWFQLASELQLGICLSSAMDVCLFIPLACASV